MRALRRDTEIPIWEIPRQFRESVAPGVFLTPAKANPSPFFLLHATFAVIGGNFRTSDN
jgi:hypothetical protein